MNQGPDQASELNPDETSTEQNATTEAEQTEQPAKAPPLTDDQYKAPCVIQPYEDRRESNNTTSSSASEVSSMTISERTEQTTTARVANTWDRSGVPKDNTGLNDKDNIADKTMEDTVSAISKHEPPADCEAASIPRENEEYATAGRQDSFEDEKELAR